MRRSPPHSRRRNELGTGCGRAGSAGGQNSGGSSPPPGSPSSWGVRTRLFAERRDSGGARGRVRGGPDAVRPRLPVRRSDREPEAELATSRPRHRLLPAPAQTLAALGSDVAPAPRSVPARLPRPAGVARATARRSPPGAAPAGPHAQSRGLRAPPAGKRSRGDDVPGAWPGVSDSGDGGKGAVAAADPPPAGWVGPGWGRPSPLAPHPTAGSPGPPKGVALCPPSPRPGWGGWGGRWGEAGGGGRGAASGPAGSAPLRGCRPEGRAGPSGAGRRFGRRR